MNVVKRKNIHEQASFLGDAVFAASDGIVTTFAIVAGSAGAALGNDIVLILGFANLFADGISMGAGNYLGTKSEVEFEAAKGEDGIEEGSPVKHAGVTFFSFGIAGLIPLVPYVLNLQPKFLLSSILVVLTLFAVGSLRSKFTKGKWLVNGLEMLAVGGLAAAVAYLAGFLLEAFVIGGIK
jgi:vacuolar iron transporter family protein